ncbi:MAG: hypothetical protein M0P97_00820 [Candidatus Moranbacteria bacterium]|jgi:hypothetical protein|nr:hypothetical protein [Candidatus Moranbacteria bacterium]
MIDSIGLGEFIANWVAVILLVVIFVSVFIFYKKNKFKGLLIGSIFLNILSYFYFIGTSSYAVFIFNVLIWPIINIILIVKYFKSNKPKN